MNYTEKLPLTKDDIFSYPLSYSYKYKNDISCFYMIKNRVNNKVYIGQTKSFYSRMRHHIYQSNRSKGLLISKEMMGRLDDFHFYILSTFEEHGIDFFTRKKITIIEQRLISKYNSTAPNGYNEYVCFK